ncbi:AmmeMemoRadiSam system protein B [bacterium]|nr:AmmeMemoRadiSam system protein B [bacterium]
MEARTRPSILSGSWFPRNPGELTGTVRDFLRKAKKTEIPGRILGMISPHAGYVYSGPAAAYGYKTLKGRKYDTVVILGPQHRMFGKRYVVTDASHYETPLGKVPVNRDALKQLALDVPLYPVSLDNEHSIEIQLPFLQTVLSSFDLIPVMIGHDDVFNVQDLVQALHRFSRNREVLIIASSDMHHMNDYRQVKERDAQIIAALESFRLDGILEKLAEPDCSVCGKVAISVLLQVSRLLGAKSLKILKHNNSGDITGEQSPGQYTVGYLSAVITDNA